MIGLPGCINAYYRAPHTAVDERVYASFYPYFAEYCAVSEFDKKKGFGVDLEGGGPGGHSVFYLNGACRVRDAGYPVLAAVRRIAGWDGGTRRRPERQRSLPERQLDGDRGTRLLLSRRSRAGRRGDTAPATNAPRKRPRQWASWMASSSISEALADKPADMSVRDYMYEISIGTDYAVDIARDRYCARVPLDREQDGDHRALPQCAERALPIRAEGSSTGTCFATIALTSRIMRWPLVGRVAGIADRSSAADCRIRLPGAEERVRQPDAAHQRYADRRSGCPV